MADIKRTWSIPTSPRNPYKLSGELGLLAKFEGRKWDAQTQALFAQELVKSGFFEGKIYEKEPEFSARDRINRSPKTFGFVRFDNKNKINITPAGRQLIEKRRLDDLFLRQLLKWQYPSVKHKGERYEGFFIKPFLEILRLVYELGGLTKQELAIFGIPLTDYRNCQKTKTEVLNFRKSLEAFKNRRDRKTFAIKTHFAEFKVIYRKEIKSGSIKLRERMGKKPSVEDFLKTKVRNSIDYADAAIRYFRATGLFTISARTFRLEILDTKKGIVETILKTFQRKPEKFEESPSAFLVFLGNSTLPILPEDKADVLVEEIAAILKKIKSVRGKPPKPKENYAKDKLSSTAISLLWDLKAELEQVLQTSLIQTEVKELQTYQRYPDIVEVFARIKDRRDIDIPDKPLFFEWNTWRALNMLDDGEIKGNLTLDSEGKPLHNAPPKFPDIVCYYKDFVLVVEVTLTSGVRQYEAEGEPVARHLGEVRRLLNAKGDQRPVFGLFIAVKINPATVAHFFILRRTKVDYYGGEAKIIPLDLDAFKQMIDRAKDDGGIKAEQIYRFIGWADSIADNFSRETEWFKAIIEKVPEWTQLRT